MPSSESFGDVLRDLLGDMPVRALAEAIHVERSVVYRWLRNERVPQLDTEHPANIAEALNLSLRARDRLQEAQIASLSKPRPPAKSASRRARTAHTAVEHLLSRTATPATAPGPISAPHQQRTHSAPSRAVVLSGRAAVLSAAIELVAAAPASPVGEPPQIMLSMQGGQLFAGLAGGGELEAGWQQALSAALARGTEVVQLWRLDRDVGRTLSLVEAMLQFVGTGRYHPRYFERYGLLRPPYDLIIVPPRAALMMFSSEGADVVDAALVLSDEEQIALATRHFAQLRAHTRKMLQEFNPQVQELEYALALADAESHVGGRMVIKDGLSALTYPPSWWRTDSRFLHYVVRSGLVKRADLPTYRAALERRWQAFLSLVRDFQYRDVCPSAVVERMASHADYARADEPLSGLDVPSQLRLEHLRHLVDMVRSYPNYHLALPDRHEVEQLSIEPAREVTGEHDAFIGTWSRNEHGDVARVDVHITEGTIVLALREHFENVWERIAEQHRERGYVLRCLEEQMALLQQRAGRR